MDAPGHFAVGLTGGLLTLLFVDWSPRREFLLTFFSGVWAMVPDSHWMLHEVGFDAVGLSLAVSVHYFGNDWPAD